MRWVAVAAVVASLPGCSFFKTELGTPVPETAPRFVVGTTTMSDVLLELGPPFELTATPDGIAFLYQQAEAVETQIGFGGGLMFDTEFVGFFKLVYARGRANRRALVLAFDQDRILSAQAHDVWQEDLGSGAAVELIFSVVSLVDTSRLEQEPSPAGWPTSLLETLPETLNARQSLSTGQSGFEQLSTPTSVGQHTLELR